LSNEEIAEVLKNLAQHDDARLERSQAWLYREMSKEQEDES